MQVQAINLNGRKAMLYLVVRKEEISNTIWRTVWVR